MNKYTITQFRLDYPDDDTCLDKIFKLRYSNLICPTCKSIKPFMKVKHRRSYQCPCCGYQIYPTKGTVFEKTTTPLINWFWAIYMQSTTRNGVAAKEFERQFKICYKTALRMAHQIKLLMANKNTSPLTGVVESTAEQETQHASNGNNNTSKEKMMGFSSQLKRTIKGTHIHVSEKHLPKYIGEVEFRWINKDKQDKMFDIVLNQVVP